LIANDVRTFDKLIEHIKVTVKARIGAKNSRRVQCISFALLHPAQYKLAKKRFDILFFCDLPHRWQNIKLVVEELKHRRDDLKLGLAFRASRQELLPDSVNLADISTFTHVTIGALYLFDTGILYTTGPSAPPSAMPRKARVVHSVMSMLSLDGFFFDDSFDAYDYILCGGVHHLDSFLQLASRRPGLSGKKLIPAGYPKLDLVLASRSTKLRPTGQRVNPTVVYAPTHSVALRQHAEAVISALLAQGHRVIFRPHPLSLNAQRDIIEQVCELCAGNPNFSLDVNKDYTESYSLADIMVTDLSGTAFTFSFSFSKPSIFFVPNAETERGLSGIQYDARHRIGALVRDLDEMVEKVSELCNRDMTDEIELFRDETMFNVGKSARYIVDCLEEILSGRERPEWVRL
jgi:CDP-Glycerol:Poly(glycerophosphate) glycerophosphotransferase